MISRCGIRKEMMGTPMNTDFQDSIGAEMSFGVY